MNSYIFIIPRTPTAFRTLERDHCWELCKESLLKQNYKNWAAIIVDEINKEEGHFKHVFSPAKTKREKLDHALGIIQKMSTKPDYIIRLDDDDIINPSMLDKIQHIKNFDVLVDRWHTCWHYNTGQIAQRTFPWFPNTCVIRTEHALSNWNFESPTSPRYMINNKHDKFHIFFANKKIYYTQKKSPLYIRTISTSSITSNNAENHNDYMNSFGIWKWRRFKDYELPCNSTLEPFIQTRKEKFRIIKTDIKTKALDLFLEFKRFTDRDATK